MLEQFRIQIYCPISRNLEMVYGIASKACEVFLFNGCDSSFHNCQSCRDCEQKVRTSLSNPPVAD